MAISDARCAIRATEDMVVIALMHRSQPCFQSCESRIGRQNRGFRLKTAPQARFWPFSAENRDLGAQCAISATEDTVVIAVMHQSQPCSQSRKSHWIYARSQRIAAKTKNRKNFAISAIHARLNAIPAWLWSPECGDHSHTLNHTGRTLFAPNFIPPKLGFLILLTNFRIFWNWLVLCGVCVCCGVYVKVWE